jgi:hypothetical protein
MKLKIYIANILVANAEIRPTKDTKIAMELPFEVTLNHQVILRQETLEDCVNYLRNIGWTVVAKEV